MEDTGRVLLLGDGAAERAERIQGGALVLLAEGDTLYEWRQRFADRSDILVSPGDRNAIPWGNGCFALIVDTSGAAPTPEMTRVLDPGRGRIIT